MNARNQILEQFAIFSGGTGGIDRWLGEDTSPEVFARLASIDDDPLPRAQLNQLLLLGHEAGVSEGFFSYYWLSVPEDHPYRVDSLPRFDPAYATSQALVSLDHLWWGLYRLYVDALLYFGNVRAAYRGLRRKSLLELQRFFLDKCYPTASLRARGPSLPLETFAKDDRYLVSEMACKSYDSVDGEPSGLEEALREAWERHRAAGGSRATIRQLLEGTGEIDRYADRQRELVFSADDILEETVTSDDDLAKRYKDVAKKFTRARNAALQNTRYYLSMVNELDVYVATSMRTRRDFRDMAGKCDLIFGDRRLAELHLRYFDPTLSAAEGHEDKGLIECLMVKSAKALVYAAGASESYGKDAEAAMALSLGKPVIFLCDEEQRGRFYRDVHPLSRLIHFETGVAVGAMVTSDALQVPELLRRIFENEMEYELLQPKPGYYRLRESLTGSVVRLQTSDALLRETFWNYYNEEPEEELG